MAPGSSLSCATVSVRGAPIQVAEELVDRVKRRTDTKATITVSMGDESIQFWAHPSCELGKADEPLLTLER